MIDKLKKTLPYVAAVLIFMVICFAYFFPVLEGKVLPQMDNNHAIGMAQEIVSFEKQTGETSQWTNSMFGGMPTFQIKGDSSANIYSYINKISRFGLPYHTIAIVFIYMLGFYLLMLSLRVNNWLSIIGSVAFALGSYNIIIILVGHITKAYAIAMMGPVIAGVMYAYNRNQIIGGVITMVALGLEIAYNHIQITYYLALLVGVLVISKLVYAIMEKQVQKFFKVSGILVAAVVLAILPNLTNLATTYDYGKYSTRSKSELTPEEGQKVSTGLDKEYAFGWSYGVAETFSLMIPNLMGGGSDPLGNSPEVIKNVNPQLKQYVAQSSQYWGSKPFTEGPVYLGAIICFLFMLGVFFYNGKDKWWLIVGTLLSFFMAWGKNFPMFSDFMFYHFPLYNKFRTVEMALILATLTVPTLGILGLREVINDPSLIRKKSTQFLAAFGLTGGVSLIFYLFPSAFFDFMSSYELQNLTIQKQQSPEMGTMIDMLISNLQDARAIILKEDALRTFIFIAIASGSLWFYATDKLPRKYLLMGLAMLTIIDMWTIDKRYLTNEVFVSSRKNKQTFQESEADKAILKDKSLDYRVFSIYKNPFSEVNTSYYHKSLGGYHGAKLRRYNDVIDKYLQTSLLNLTNVLSKGASYNDIDNTLAQDGILNMLNTKYIIYNPSAEPIVNPYAFGNAWFVNEVFLVDNADEEIASIGAVNLKETAVVDATFTEYVRGYLADSIGGAIQLTEYKPNYLKYNANAPADQMAVFSEIYYPSGWSAYIDGNEVDCIRANYILRALLIPKGEHIVEFRFEPASFTVGKWLSGIGSLFVLLIIAGTFYWIYKRRDVLEM